MMKELGMLVKFPKDEENEKLSKRLYLNSLDECLSFPKYFEIETVNICNARCVMCAISVNKIQKGRVMSKGLFGKFVNEVRNYTDWIETICLNRDGEPILDKNLSDRVKMLKDIGIKKVTFATNGQLLHPNLVHQLINAGLDDIMVSIDAMAKHTFELIRVGLNYETVLKNTLELINIRNNRRSKMTIRIRMVVMDENKHEVEEWIAFWNSKVLERDTVYAKPIHTWGNQIGQEGQDMIAKYADKPCVSPFSTVVIKVDGRIPLCGADYNVENIMGDFSRQTIKEIWDAQPYRKLRLLHANKQRNKISMCRGCHIWDRDLMITKNSFSE